MSERHPGDEAPLNDTQGRPKGLSSSPEILSRGLRLYLEDLYRAGVRHVLFPPSWDSHPRESDNFRESRAGGLQIEAIRESTLAASKPETAPQVLEDVTTSPGRDQKNLADASQEGSPRGMPKKHRGSAESLESRSADHSAVSRTEGSLPLISETSEEWGDVALPEGNSREEILANLARQVAECVRCPALVANRTQTVFGVGNPYSELVFIGEAPGYDEDVQGFPFVGRAGQLLTAMITNGMGMRREDVYICNILRCRPPNNRTPTREEAAHCRPWLDATLAVIQPKYICCLGNVAAQNLLGTDLPISRLRGKVWNYRGAKVVCTFHPAFLLRNPAMKREAWEDIKLLLEVMGRPIPRRSSPGDEQ